MDFSKILPAIATVAPTIAGLIGGPLASMGVTALESVFGLAPGTATSNPQALQTAVAAMSPDDAVKLAQADSDLKAKLAQAGVDMAKIAADDTANARAREIAVKDHAPMVLAVLLTVGFFGVLAFMMIHGLPKDTGGSEAMIAMIGGLATGFSMVLSYYFGSSASSRIKDDTISTLSKG